MDRAEAWARTVWDGDGDGDGWDGDGDGDDDGVGWEMRA